MAVRGAVPASWYAPGEGGDYDEEAEDAAREERREAAQERAGAAWEVAGAVLLAGGTMAESVAAYERETGRGR